MGSKANLFTSFMLYSAGLASLFLIDVFISKWGSVENISLWAFLRSSAMLAGFIVLMGSDQALIRNYERVGSKVFIVMLSMVCVISMPVAYALSGIREDVSFWTILVFVLAIALTGVVSSYFRARLEIVVSQFISNNWKWVFLLVLGCVYFFGYNVDIGFSLTLASCLVLVINMAFLVKIYLGFKRQSLNPMPVKLFFTDGFRFLIMGSTLNLSVNLEQVLLNQVGTPEDGAYLFSYITAFGSVFILANGFYGFLLGPYAKRNKEVILESYNKFLVCNAACCGVLLFAAAFIGLYLYDFLYATKFVLRKDLMVIILLIFGLRFLYVVPSALIGFAGGAEVFNRYLRVNMFSLALFVAAFFILNNILKDGVLAVMLASLVNWLVRVFYGAYLIKQGLRA